MEEVQDAQRAANACEASDADRRAEVREAFVRYPPLREAPAMGDLSQSKQAAVHAEADATFEALDLNEQTMILLEECVQKAQVE